MTAYVNIAPVVNLALVDQSVQETASKTYTFASNSFTDSDGHGLTYSATLSSGAALPSWISFNATTRTFTLTPAYGNQGNHYVKVTANDGHGGTVSDTFTIYVSAGPNRSPYVNSAIPNRTATEAITSYYTVSSTAFIDPDGNALSYSATLDSGAALPSWITFNATTRQFTFNPNYGNAGSYNIKVTATDGSLSASDTFSLTVNSGANRAPTVSSGVPNQTAQETVYWSYIVPSNAFNDPDGDSLTYSAQYYKPGHYTMGGYDQYGEPILIWNPPAWTSTLPSWMSFTSSTRKFTGTPPRNTVASVQLRVIATDPDGLTATDELTLTISDPPNSAPTVNTAIPNRSGTVGSAFSYTFPSTTFSDIDGDTLTYSASGMPSWLSFTGSTRTFSGTPSAEGTWNITVTANDGQGGSVSDTFSLTVTQPANTAPIVNRALWDQSVERFTPLSYTFASDSFIDGDGDSLTYTATQSSGYALPSWLSFNASTRTFSGVTGTTGTTYVRVTASDGRGGSVSDTFSITVFGGGGGGGGMLQSVGSSTELSSTTETTLVEHTAKEIAQLDDIETRLVSMDLNYSTVNLQELTTWFNEVRGYIPATSIKALSDLSKQMERYLSQGKMAQFNQAMVEFGNLLPVPSDQTSGVSSVSTTSSSNELSLMSTSTQSSTINSIPDNLYEPDSRWFDESQIPVDVRQFKEYWYTYDKENRVLIAEGVQQVDAQGVITGIGINKDQGSIIEYDAAGNQILRVNQVSNNAYEAERFVYNERGEMTDSYKLKKYDDARTDDWTLKSYRDTTLTNEALNTIWQKATDKEYDLAGRMVKQRDYYIEDSWRTVTVRRREDYQTEPGDSPYITESLDIFGQLKSAQYLTYDRDGRAVTVDNFGIAEGYWENSYEFAYLLEFGIDPGADLHMNMRQIDESELSNLSDIVYGTNGYDAAGNLVNYQYVKLRKGEKDTETKSSYTFSYNYQYNNRHERYQNTRVIGSGSGEHHKDGTTTTIYNASNQAIKTVEAYADDTGQITTEQHRYLRNNGDGQLLYKSWGEYDRSNQTYTEEDQRHYYYAQQQLIGSVGANGKILFDEVAGYQLASSEGAGNASHYTVQHGDSLKSIARLVYGSESLWYVLADANGMADSNPRLEAGQTLKTPSFATNVNDAETFKAYNMDEIIGDRTPAIPDVPPPPPVDDGCGVLGQIIMIVVMVVVTVYTAGAAASAFAGSSLTAGTGTWAAGTAALSGGSAAMGIGAGAAMAGAAVGSFVGSVASQLVGKAMGNVQSFSLRQAIGAGLTAGAMAGVGSALQNAGMVKKLKDGSQVLSNWGRVAAAAISVPVGVGVNKAVGLPASFSWQNVAMASIAAGVGNLIGGDIDNQVAEASDTLTEAQRLAAQEAAKEAMNTAISFSWEKVLLETGTAMLNKGITHVIRKALYGEGSWNMREVFADSFGNALANTFVSTQIAKDKLFQEQKAMSDKLMKKINEDINKKLSDKLNETLDRMNDKFNNELTTNAEKISLELEEINRLNHEAKMTAVQERRNQQQLESLEELYAQEQKHLASLEEKAYKMEQRRLDFEANLEAVVEEALIKGRMSVINNREQIGLDFSHLPEVSISQINTSKPGIFSDLWWDNLANDWLEYTGSTNSSLEYEANLGVSGAFLEGSFGSA